MVNWHICLMVKFLAHMSDGKLVHMSDGKWVHMSDGKWVHMSDGKLAHMSDCKLYSPVLCDCRRHVDSPGGSSSSNDCIIISRTGSRKNVHWMTWRLLSLWN